MTTKKNLLSGMAAIALGMAVTNVAWATGNDNPGESKEANDGVVAQSTDDGNLNAAEGSGNGGVGGDGAAIGADAGGGALGGNGIALGAEADGAVVGGNGFAFGEDFEGGVVFGNGAAVGDDNSGAVADNLSVAIVSDSDSATAINNSAAVQDGGLVVGDGTAIGENNSGAIASGDGSVAVNGSGDEKDGIKVEENFKVEFKSGLFNNISADISMSYADLGQTTADITVIAGARSPQEPDFVGAGGTLRTGTMDAEVSRHLGVSGAGLNSGVVNQGAAVGISTVASAN